MKKIVLLMISIVNLIYGWDADIAKFYPLAIGNVWSYHKTPYGNTFCYALPQTSDYNISITGDTILPNGKKYYIFSNGWYERIDSITMNVYRYSQPHELMLDSLFAKKNDQFHGYRLDFFNSNCSITDTFPYYIFNNTWREKTISLSANGTNEYTLASGLGMVRLFKCFQTGYEDVLNGCIINGVQYGNIVSTESNKEGIPINYSLSQNYPNPFNPTTKIKFNLPKFTFTKLIIYDIRGREAATIVNEELKLGSYEYTWDGYSFASGVYFYKLMILDPETISGFAFFQTKRMVLIK